MEDAVSDGSPPIGAELPATAYPYHHQIFGSDNGSSPTGLLFDTQNFAVMSIVHPPESQTPDLNADKDGDRILMLVNGDLALQIGEHRFRLGPGDAVRIPRGTRFGRSLSATGAHLLLIRAKPIRSFSITR